MKETNKIENVKDLIPLDVARCNDDLCPSACWCERNLQRAIDWRKGNQGTLIKNFQGVATRGLCKHFLNVKVSNETN